MKRLTRGKDGVSRSDRWSSRECEGRAGQGSGVQVGVATASSTSLMNTEDDSTYSVYTVVAIELQWLLWRYSGCNGNTWSLWSYSGCYGDTTVANLLLCWTPAASTADPWRERVHS